MLKFNSIFNWFLCWPLLCFSFKHLAIDKATGFSWPLGIFFSYFDSAHLLKEQPQRVRLLSIVCHRSNTKVLSITDFMKRNLDIAIVGTLSEIIEKVQLAPQY